MIKVQWIYGLFDKAGFCHYVGQTRYCYLRACDHQNTGLQFRVFRHCKYADAGRLERQIYNAYKRRGQATLNKRVPNQPMNRRVSTPIYSSKVNRTFTGYGEAALYFDTTATDIGNNCKGLK